MKIGIISEFKIRTLNYGNHLQAYALNYYVNKIMGYNAESIQLRPSRLNALKLYITNPISLLKVLKKKRIASGQMIESKEIDLERRYQAFAEFAHNNIRLSEEMGWKELCVSDYDYFIVGSDVVWQQYPGLMRRVKWLDFTNAKNAHKVSYAASMGKDWIPKENRNITRKYLKGYKAISLREYSSVNYLKELKICEAEYVLDPTLLLDKSDWEKVEQMPKMSVPENDLSAQRYVFSYLLAVDDCVRREVKEFCKKNQYTLVSIPYAKGIWMAEDENFGDIQILNCSPQEWIWLIHHADLVLTDSFHGVVYSTIFQKKFFALERRDNVGFGNRIKDYLSLIKQTDKHIFSVEGMDINTYCWNYDEIDLELSKMREKSKDYLGKALS